MEKTFEREGRRTMRCSLRLAGKATKRLRGLLGVEPHDETLLLMPCHDVHTLGMRHNLDVAFISADGLVLAVHRDVKPARRLAHPWAEAVLERFAMPGEPWLVVGERIRIQS